MAKSVTKDANGNVVSSVTDRDYSVPSDLSRVFRQRAQIINYAQLKDIMLQNVSKSSTKTFTQYTKANIINYLKSPYTNLDNIRAVSQFLYRVSMIYKKIIEYTAQMPLFYYNISYKYDLSKGFQLDAFNKVYYDLCARMQVIDFKKEFSQIIATALRDGIYNGFIYDNEEDGFMIQPLDPKYCKVSGISQEGQYIIKFNASYFDNGNNKEYLYGVNEDGEGTWDQVFIDGYETYKNDGRDFMWFELPPERTICILAGDDYEMPLPYYVNLFISLLDLIDLEQIIADKTELENYVLLVSKIPLIENSGEVDDFAVSLDMVRATQSLINEAVPPLVGTAFTPCDLDVVTFTKSDQADNTDKLAQSMSNLFSNMGVTELVVSGGHSTNATGLRHSIQVDEAMALRFVDKLESWVNYYIKYNITENAVFKFHPITYFSQKEYVEGLAVAMASGAPVKYDYLTALGKTPYEMISDTWVEYSMGLTDMWVPLQTAYTMTNNGKSDEGGAPPKDEGDLTDEGERSKQKREGNAE